MVSPESDPRERIIGALAVIVARDGYRASKIHDIAAEARVSLRTFYAHFENKEACFLVLHERLIRLVTASVEDAVTFDDQPWRDAVRQGFEVYFRLLSAQPLLTSAVVLEFGTLSDEAYSAREFARDEFSRLLSTLVDRGRAANPEIPSRQLTPLMARGLVGSVLELVTSRVVRGETDHMPELIETATDLCWSVVRNVSE